MVVGGGAAPMWPISSECKSSEEKREREGFHSEFASRVGVFAKRALMFGCGTIGGNCGELPDFVNRIRRDFYDRHLDQGLRIGPVRFDLGQKGRFG